LRGSELKDHPQDNVQVPPMVVVADDDGEHRLLLSRLLRKAGFRVSLAQDGASLMKLLAANQPDLVLLDLMLPDDDGLVLCRRIRDTSDIPIIMLTALGQGTYKVAGLEMGADDYVAKPFDPDELLDGFDRSVDILVSRLRRKIEPNAKEPRIIKTIRSGGYLFAPDVGPLGPL
jgi:DNA-binding response OmpR family regulator